MEALEHLEYHISFGDEVPERAIKRLKEEILEIGDDVD
jgi:bifunctional ADP-heptose synthase (sugar kinase/adenylyltransferase)